MGSQKMLVNVQEDETRIALTENDLLVDLHIEQTTHERTVGNIYCGTVVKVNPAFQAAFIEYGESRNGFLSASDISSALVKGANGQRGRPKIQSVLKTGQHLMVQVLKEGMRAKGAALTTAVSLPGRYLVLTTQSDRSGVSRKIEDSEQRSRLKEVVAGLMGNDDKGVIIRTAGFDRTPAELKRDLSQLQKEWKSIDGQFAKSKKPRLLYQELKSLLRVLRDYFSEEVEEVWVDSPEAYQVALAYFKATLPKFQKRLKLYVGDKSVFSAHRIEEQIAALDSSRVSLPSGGGIVIEPTEALVTIDVNSGRSNQASDIEATALATNLEAAEEVGRQLRLRNLGGLVVLDFIDMMPAKNRARVEEALAKAMANDKARISFGKISEFGLLELSRQRIDVELTRGSRERCENCGGTGHVPTVNTSANAVLRKIRELAASGDYAEIEGKLPLEQANFLLNHRRESLRDLELEFDLQIYLTGDPALPGAHQLKLVGKRAAQEEEGEDPVIESEGVTAEESSSEEGGGASRPRRRRRRRGRRGEGEGSAAGQEQGTEHEAMAGGGGDAQEEEEPPEDDIGTAYASEEPEADSLEDEDSTVEEEGGTDNGQRPPSEPVERLPAAPVAALGGPPVLPAVFSSKRGGWLAKLNDEKVAPGKTLFESGHVEGEPSEMPIIFPIFKRSGPFIGVEAEESTTLFESSHREGAGNVGALDAPAPRKAGKSAAGGKTGKGRSGAAASGGAPRKSRAKGRSGGSSGRSSGKGRAGGKSAEGNS